MPFDGIFTASIVKELSTLINGRIDKIHQPARDEIMLFIKKDRGGSKVLFSASLIYLRKHNSFYTLIFRLLINSIKNIISYYSTIFCTYPQNFPTKNSCHF
jgi:hypothetical protein